jgi:hypothetical protein
MVEPLPSKCEALSSDTSTTKKEKKSFPSRVFTISMTNSFFQLFSKNLRVISYAGYRHIQQNVSLVNISP